MFEKKRIKEAYKSAKRLEIDNKTKLVIISDCHRGTGGGADNFAQNQLLFCYALKTYYMDDFVYIELGDGDELWENKSMAAIKSEYDHIFALLARMYRDGKLLMIYGNHDIVKRNPKWCRENLTVLYTHNHTKEAKMSELFKDIKVHQAILLNEKGTDNEILLLHGHQADFFNDRLYRLSRFLVRYLWRPLELVGIKDPASTSLNPKKKDKVEEILMDWCDKNNKAIIAGHTHKPIYPQPGETPYFNDGSCVHPRYINAIEIQKGEIAIVKWEIGVLRDGKLNITKEILRGPNRIDSFFTNTNTNANVNINVKTNVNNVKTSVNTNTDINSITDKMTKSGKCVWNFVDGIMKADVSPPYASLMPYWL